MRPWWIGLAAFALVAVPAQADQGADQATDPAATDRKVDEMIETSKQVFGVAPPRRQTCTQSDPNEIVVCRDRGRPQQVESTAETDPNSLAGRRFRDGNIPTAPQLDHGYCPSCQHFGSVPPPAYYVDVGALPQAPEGSDADKISKGETPAP